jgi:coproporphyrinogen III oxidase-like Fe-S oxidoreductase
MLGLRLISVIDLQSFEQDYGVDLLTLKKTAIESMLAEQLLQLSDGRLLITAKGIPISNSIISSLI